MKKIQLTICLALLTLTICGQNNNLTIHFNRILFGDLVDTVERLVPVKIYYSEKWVDSLYLSVNAVNESFDELISKILRKKGLNFIITEKNKVILSKGYSIKTTFQDEYLEYINKNYSGEDAIEQIMLVKEQEKKQINDAYKIFRIGNPSSDRGESKATLSGTVIDPSEGEPVSGAFIYVEKLRSGAITNSAGFYSIILPKGQYQIEYRMVGMKPTRRNVIIYSSGVLDVEMEPFTEQLDEVLISANRQNNVTNVRIGIEKINPKMLKQIPLGLGEADIIRSALSLPGVQSVGEAAGGFNVRGGNTDQNLILLDNAPVINSSHFFGFFSALNSDLISNITLYKSGMPAKYGGRISSVMEIESASGNMEKVKVSGGISPVTGRLLVEGPVVKNKCSFIIGTRTTYSDWILGSLDDIKLKNSSANFHDIQGKINCDINEKNSLTLSGYYSNDRFIYYQENSFNYGNLASSLRWKHTFNQKLSVQSYAIISNYNYNLDEKQDSTSFSSLYYELNQKIFRTDFLYFPNESHKIEFGVEAIYYSLLPGISKPLGDYSVTTSKRIENEKAFESSFYLSDEFEITPNLSLSGGVRVNLFTSFGPKTEFRYDEKTSRKTESITDTIKYESGEIIKFYPKLDFRLSSRLIILPDLSVKFGIQRVHQNIHMISNTTSMSPYDIWKLSDSHIKPQRGDQFSLGLYKNFRRIAVETSIEAYYKRLSHIIDYKGGAVLLMNEHLETDIINAKGKAYGIELMIKKETGALTGWISYTYSRTLLKIDELFDNNKFTGSYFSPANYDKPHDFKFVTNYRLSRRLNMTSNFVYNTGRPITYPVAFFEFNNTTRFYYSNRNEYRIPNYMRLDLSMTINGNLIARKLNHSSLTATVYNFLGRKNPYSIFFKNEGGEIKSYQMTIFAQPIFVLTYNFRLFGNARDDF